MGDINPLDNIDLAALGLGPKQESTKKNDELDQADFFTLLVAQLENQDPMEPQDNAEFVSQIAQFGMLDGINGLNDNFDSLSSSLTSSQALEASSMVGRAVVIPAESTFYAEGDLMFGTMELESSVPDLTLSISDESGSLVKRELLGVTPGGTIPFLWDGLNESGEPVPSGQYTVSAIATVNGETQSIPTNLTFNVDSVTLGKEGSGLMLNLAGHDPVSLSEVKEIR